jgi:hypothetical protein
MMSSDAVGSSLGCVAHMELVIEALPLPLDVGRLSSPEELHKIIVLSSPRRRIEERLVSWSLASPPRHFRLTKGYGAALRM